MLLAWSVAFGTRRIFFGAMVRVAESRTDMKIARSLRNMLCFEQDGEFIRIIWPVQQRQGVFGMGESIGWGFPRTGKWRELFIYSTHMRRQSSYEDTCRIDTSA